MNVVYFGIYPGRCYDFLCHYRTPPPPQFLIGFGRIRKLASVRNGGDESPPVHPVAPPLVLFTGGWAMKFVPVFGKILSDLAIHGQTEYQDLIQPMNINRGILLPAKDSPEKKIKPSKCSVAEKQKALRKIWC